MASNKKKLPWPPLPKRDIFLETAGSEFIIIIFQYVFMPSLRKTEARRDFTYQFNFHYEIISSYCEILLTPQAP